MIPQFQTRTENGGDCLRACIATMLGEAIQRVPDFTAGEDPTQMIGGFPKYYLDLQKYLRERNLFFLEIPLSGRYLDAETNEWREVSTMWHPQPMDSYCIIVGLTAGGMRHMLVGRTQGERFVRLHDPHPDNPGIREFLGVCFLVPVDPSRFFAMGLALDRIEKLAIQIHKLTNSTLALEIVTEARAVLRPNEVQIAG